ALNRFLVKFSPPPLRTPNSEWRMSTFISEVGPPVAASKLVRLVTLHGEVMTYLTSAALKNLDDRGCKVIPCNIISCPRRYSFPLLIRIQQHSYVADGLLDGKRDFSQPVALDDMVWIDS